MPLIINFLIHIQLNEAMLIGLIVCIFILAGGFIYYMKQKRHHDIILEKLVSERMLEIETKNQEIIYQREELLASNQSKDRIISIIAHDLKNPFSALQGFAELLFNYSKQLTEEKKEEIIKQLYQTTYTANGLLDNLLNWARVQNHRMVCSPTEISLEELAEDSISLLMGNIKSKNIEIVKRYENGCSAYADPNMIASVIRNLLSNAIKYTKPGGQIKFSTSIGHDIIEIIIEDNGIGMAPDVLKNLFKSSSSVSIEGTIGERGTGLGLLICKDFISLNKGEITAHSKLGGGTQFKFILPKFKPDIFILP